MNAISKLVKEDNWTTLLEVLLRVFITNSYIFFGFAIALGLSLFVTTGGSLPYDNYVMAISGVFLIVSTGTLFSVIRYTLKFAIRRRESC